MQIPLLPLLIAFLIGMGIYGIFHLLLMLWQPLPFFLSWGVLCCMGLGAFINYLFLFCCFPVMIMSFVGGSFTGMSVRGSEVKYWWAIAGFFPAQILGMYLNASVGFRWIPDGTNTSMAYLATIVVSPTIGAFSLWIGKKLRGTLPELAL